MVYFFYYELSFYFEGEKEKVKGITYGENWEEVMRHLVEYYGEIDLAEIYCLKSFSEGGPCFEIEDIKEFLKNE